jgi:hypothetical protein
MKFYILILVYILSKQEDSMEYSSELEVRQEIMIRLDVVYELINDLIQISFQRNHKTQDGRGYRLGINRNNYREFESNFSDFYSLKDLITEEFTTNYKDWHDLITLVYDFLGLFRESKALFMTLFETTSLELVEHRDKIKKFVQEKKIDAVKNSVEYNKIKSNMTLKEQFDLVCKEQNISIDGEYYDLDFEGKQDFIIYNFVSAKYEIAINGINEEFADFINNNHDKVPHFDNMSYMLEMMHDDGLISEEDYQDFEAYYEDIVPLILDIEDLEIITKDGEPLNINSSELSSIEQNKECIGDVVANRLEGMEYYYLVLTGAPAEHFGILLLDEKTDKDLILKKLKLIEVEGYTTGFSYDGVEDFFDIGEQIKQKYVTAKLIDAEEISGKNFKELFE